MADFKTLAANRDGYEGDAMFRMDLCYPIPLDSDDVDVDPTEDDAVKMQELNERKRKHREMEVEAAALCEMQSKVKKEMGVVYG